MSLSYCTEKKVREADGEKRREAQRSAEKRRDAFECSFSGRPCVYTCKIKATIRCHMYLQVQRKQHDVGERQGGAVLVVGLCEN